MHNIFILALALLISSCANNNFVPTPVEEEINILTYSIESPSGTRIWRLTNDNLQVRLTTKAKSGKVISNTTIKTTPNNYNLVAYNLEQAGFQSAQSIPTPNPTQNKEVLMIETQADVYTFTQNSSSRFPADIQKVMSTIPSLFPIR